MKVWLPLLCFYFFSWEVGNHNLIKLLVSVHKIILGPVRQNDTCLYVMHMNNLDCHRHIIVLRQLNHNWRKTVSLASYHLTSSFVMLDSLAADQAFVIIITNVESSWLFSAKWSIFLQAASTEGELIISWNFNSAAFSASMLSVAESYACTAAKHVFPILAKPIHIRKRL